MHNRKAILGICVLLTAATLATFGRTVRYDFVKYDDNVYVYDNPHVAAGLSPRAVAWAFTEPHGGNWHPLTTLSHMLDCQLYGLWPGGHHLTNVLLHAATSVLLFLVLRRMTGSLWSSACVAAVFALHPLRAESVAWISERKDVLSGLFFMLTLAAYVRYATRPFRSSRYLLVVFVYALGLLAKPMLVSVPFVLLLLDYWPLGRLRLPGMDASVTAAAGRLPNAAHGAARLLAEKIPLLLLAAGSCVVTACVQREAIAHVVRVALPWRIANALVAYVAYLGKFFWPVNLAVLYPHPQTDLPAWEIVGAVLVLAAISVLTVACRGKRAYLPVGWLWYLGMLVPVIGLVQVGRQAMADRYTYLPQIGLCLALTWTAADLLRDYCPARTARIVGGAAGVLLIEVLMAHALVQTAHWRNSRVLWSHTLACTVGNAVAHNDLGQVCAAEDQPAEALDHYRQALEIDPRYAQAHSNLGSVLQQQGRVADALTHFGIALDIDPQLASAHNNSGVALRSLGRNPEALAEYRRALRIKADFAEAQYNLGDLLLATGQFDEAVVHLQQAVAIRPTLAPAHNDLARAWYRQKKFSESRAQWREFLRLQQETLRLRPASVTVLLQTAYVLATCPDDSIRDPAQALKLARQAIELTGRATPTALDTLAVAQAAAGQPAEALRSAEQALALATAQNLTALIDRLRARIRLYRTGAAYRDGSP
jgi:tetratricopeptide (TPR) repeat protein